MKKRRRKEHAEGEFIVVELPVGDPKGQALALYKVLGPEGLRKLWREMGKRMRRRKLLRHEAVSPN